MRIVLIYRVNNQSHSSFYQLGAGCLGVLVLYSKIEVPIHLGKTGIYPSAKDYHHLFPAKKNDYRASTFTFTPNIRTAFFWKLSPPISIKKTT